MGWPFNSIGGGYGGYGGYNTPIFNADSRDGGLVKALVQFSNAATVANVGLRQFAGVEGGLGQDIGYGKGMGNIINGGYQETRAYGQGAQGNANQAAMYNYQTGQQLNGVAGQGGDFVAAGSHNGHNQNNSGVPYGPDWSPSNATTTKEVNTIEKELGKLDKEIREDQAQYDRLHTTGSHLFGFHREGKQERLLEEIKKDEQKAGELEHRLVRVMETMVAQVMAITIVSITRTRRCLPPIRCITTPIALKH